MASHSPRRRGLLERLGVTFFVQAAPTDAEEAITAHRRGREAHQVALARAQVKGEAVAATVASDCAVLSADTVVHLEDLILDKPQDEAMARDFLRKLSGREHGVITGLWLRSSRGQVFTWHEQTWVDFAPLSEAAIEAYIATGEPFDKAGGYGIQGVGGALVRGIRGCYFNVMGLPLHATSRLLNQAGVANVFS